MDRTFGIEIEVYNLAPHAAARAIQAAGVTCRAEGYNHATRSYWKATTDVSITGGNTCEIVSPILRGEEGLEQVRAVMAAITAAGAKVNKSCGLHVHIGAADLKLNEIRNIAKNYVLFEDFFDAIMPLSRRACNNIYIASNRAKAGGGYDRRAAYRVAERLDQCATIDDVIRTVCPGAERSGQGRYHKLNLVAYWVHGTIEFRQHAGTTDGEKAVNWIRLLMQFVNRAAVTRQRQRKDADAKVTPAALFNAFFRCFQIADKAYFTARRDMLHAETGEGPRVSNTMERLARQLARR